MNKSVKKSIRLAQFLGLTTLVFFFLSIITFFSQRKAISFTETIKNPDIIFTEKLIERAQDILTQTQDIRKRLTLDGGKEKRSLASENYTNQYNSLANEYNALNDDIEKSIFLKENIELKNRLIWANKDAYSFLDATRNAIASRKNSGLAKTDATSFLEKYEQLKNDSALTEFSFFSLNPPTLKFLFSLFGFMVSASLSIYMLLRFWQRTRKELHQKAAELKTFMSVIDNMSEGVVVADRFGFFTYFNQSATEILGHQAKDLYYQSSIDQIGFSQLDGKPLTKEETPFFKAAKKNVVTDQEILVRNAQNPDGVFVSASNGYYTDGRGETLGVVVVLKNISQKKQMEELWKKEKESALENSQKKSDFLASMSHEIRTPMNGIIGLTTLLSETHLNNSQTEYVDTIQRSAHSLLALINDILDHSKIEAGKVELLPQNFDLKFLIKDVVENFKYACAEKNNSISFEWPENLDPYFYADSNRMRQVLINLTGNAVKFTRDGQIKIKVLKQSQTGVDCTLQFRVEDTGPGMDKNELERLFQRFFQTKSGIKFGGTGLGLSICKQLVDLMKGKIGVESTPNVGSTFWFELPLLMGQKTLSQSPKLTLSEYAGCFKGHVLVAEDNLINQKVIHQFLDRLGLSVTLCSNGQEAVQHFETTHFDLILMDCNMPVMNGYQATQAILKMKKKAVPVVALTAEGVVTGLQKCLDSGMSDFINKPILVEELILTLKKYLPINTPPSTQVSNLDNQETTPLQLIEENSLFDFEQFIKLGELSSGQDLLVEVLFEDYQATTPGHFSEMLESIEKHDYESLSQLAHSLKSASAALGAKKVSQICQHLEKNAFTLNADQLKTSIRELTELYNKTLPLIEKQITALKRQSA